MIANRYLEPITSSCGLIDMPLNQVVDEFIEWQQPILQPLNSRLEIGDIVGGVDVAFRSLLPLTSPIATRFLFMTSKSGWTVFFDNGWRGTDAAGPMAVLAGRCRRSALRVVAQRHTMRSIVLLESRGYFGASILEVYNEDGTTRRTIFAANDGGKWKFGQSGEPFDFEDISAYSRKSLKERFTIDMLGSYLRSLGVDAFDKNWFLCDETSPAILISRTGGLPPNLQEYQLDNS